MTTGHVYIATSLDGFVARKNHQIDWLNKQPVAGEDHGFDDFLDGVDGIVMGRGSYETVLGFGNWPYKKPVRVMSRTISQNDIPADLQEKVCITTLDPHDLMLSLAEEGWSRAYIDGGKVVQSFIECGLIDDIVLTLVPILIGDGIRLFGNTKTDIDLELLDVKSFESGLAQIRYRLKTRESMAK